MAISIIEIKARCSERDRIRKILEGQNARFVGLDHQVDTYYSVPTGRLKLRQGNIENTLIAYDRPDKQGPKHSKVSLYRPVNPEQLATTLEEALDVKVVVDKQREIYFIDNVKFHIDSVEGLGSFIEIEAIDEEGDIGVAALQIQCEQYLELFGVDESDLVTHSYSDLLLNSKNESNVSG